MPSPASIGILNRCCRIWNGSQRWYSRSGGSVGPSRHAGQLWRRRGPGPISRSSRCFTKGKNENGSDSLASARGPRNNPLPTTCQFQRNQRCESPRANDAHRERPKTRGVESKDMTPSQAKNAIRRSLVTLIDPEPGKQQKAALKEHFNGRCAYCDKHAGERPHLDHLEAGTKQGRNHISNRVLACEKCNGNEKLAHPWERFLEAKCGGWDNQKFRERSARIHAWVTSGGPAPALDKEIRLKLDEETERAIQAYDHACEILRALRRVTQSK